MYLMKRMHKVTSALTWHRNMIKRRRLYGTTSRLSYTSVHLCGMHALLYRQHRGYEFLTSCVAARNFLMEAAPAAAALRARRIPIERPVAAMQHLIPRNLVQVRLVLARNLRDHARVDVSCGPSFVSADEDEQEVHVRQTTPPKLYHPAVTAHDDERPSDTR